MAILNLSLTLCRMTQWYRACTLLIKLHCPLNTLLCWIYIQKEYQFGAKRDVSISLLTKSKSRACLGIIYRTTEGWGLCKWEKGDKPCSAESHSPTIHRRAESHESVGNRWEVYGMVEHRRCDSTNTRC